MASGWSAFASSYWRITGVSFFLAAGCSDGCIAGVLVSTAGEVYAGFARLFRCFRGNIGAETACRGGGRRLSGTGAPRRRRVSSAGTGPDRAVGDGELARGRNELDGLRLELHCVADVREVQGERRERPWVVKRNACPARARRP